VGERKESKEGEAGRGRATGGAAPRRRRLACRHGRSSSTALHARDVGGGQNRMELGFPGAAGGRGFVHARRAVSRRIIICGDGRLLASSESWAGFWPRRTQCVGRFGGPAIGCWTTGPGGRKGGGHGPH
jgi:hypothetical protein